MHTKRPLRHLRNILTIIILTIFFTSCGIADKKFDKAAWNDQYDIMYVNRESMIQDLIANHLHKGMTYKELTELIGEPENYTNMKENTIAYEIMVDYGLDIDPVEGKNLYIELSTDSTVVGYRLEHWKH